jgi:dolichol kinase
VRRLITAFCSLGFFACVSPDALLPQLLGVAATATLVESLPINSVLDDNLTVPLVSAAMAMLLLPHAATAAAAAVALA